MTGATSGGVLPVHTSKLDETRVSEGRIAPKLEAFNRIHGRGQFDAFAGDFAGDIDRRDMVTGTRTLRWMMS